MALRGANPGAFDHVIAFYAPVKSRDSINAEVITQTLQAGTVRAHRVERVFKNAEERMEANQQVGATTRDFRVHDVRSQYAITQEWEFDVYSIENTTDVKRYKVRGIEAEGRKNFLRITGEYRDN